MGLEQVLLILRVSNSKCILKEATSYHTKSYQLTLSRVKVYVSTGSLRRVRVEKREPNVSLFTTRTLISL